MSHEHNEPKADALVFGDASIVRYPNGDEVLGGHAFSVAWHLRGLARSVLMVSRVGDDAAGDDVIRALEAWEVPTVGIQRAVGESTGVARVEPGEGPPTVVMDGNQPWDRISADESVHALRTASCALIVHGTRCLRSASNRRLLDRLIEESGAPIYFDAAADPALESQELERCIARSRWVSVQRDGLATIARSLGLAADKPERLAERLVASYDVSVMFVMEDVRGAFAITESGERHTVQPAGDLNVIDRVGVEEAFTAVAACGVLAGWTVPETLRRSQGFAELVAALPAPEIPTAALYDDVRRQWAAESTADERDQPDASEISAISPIPEETRLPAQLEQASDALDELRQRRESARMRASIASDVALEGDAESDQALERAERSVKRISDRIDETKKRLQSLRRAARENRTVGDVEVPRALVGLEKVWGATTVATDGELGELRDAYVDEENWDVPYLIVDVVAQSPEQSVLIGPDEIIEPDWEGGSFHVDADLQTLLASTRPKAGAANLFRTQQISKFAVEAEGKSCGRLEDLVLDDREWLIRYVKIETGTIMNPRYTLVPTAWVERIDWAEESIIVGVSSDAIDSAPIPDQSGLIGRDYELQLFKHYGARHGVDTQDGGG